MKTKIEVEVIKHQDVRGKELYYIKIGNHIVNVGMGTYSAILKVLTDEENNDVSRETENKTETEDKKKPKK